MTKLFVPAELLEKLHCSVCKSYLSVFPIHIKNDGDHPICGRCKIPNEDDYLRDEAYEGIAQFLIFPCSQAKNGCTEQLTPLKLKDHENCCTYRKLDCPSKNFSKCVWQGPSKDLKVHFETSHPTLLLTNSKFEIQFVHSLKENLLLAYENELFIVKNEIDSRSGTFTCSVEHVIQTEDPDYFNYFLRVMSGNASDYYKFPERSTMSNAEEKTKFTREFIREKLNDPAAIIAQIEIVKTGLKEEEPQIQIEHKSPDVDWDLLAELECPICFEYMLAPIYQCLNGHSICSTCKPKVAECPMCKNEIKNTQNFALEKLTVRMVYPCKYHKMGCAITLKSSEVRRHEGSCQYGPYNCPLAEVAHCETKFTKSEIIGHVESVHDEFILKSDKVSVPFANENTPIDKYNVIKFANRIFKVCFKYGDQKFYWALQLVGPAEECKKFKYEIDIIDNSDKKLRQFVRGLCVPTSKQEECFTTKGSYVMFLYDQICDLIGDNLSYRIRVLKD